MVLVILTKKIIQIFAIGATIRNNQESWCLPYAGFFTSLLHAEYFYLVFSSTRNDEELGGHYFAVNQKN